VLSDEQPVLLSALPPSHEQQRVALTVTVLLLAAFLITLPFRDVQLARVDAFVPIVDTVLFLGDLITAALLFAQFSVLRSRALLALACGYLFTSFIIVPHALTFPGVFSATGLLGANLQSTVWLYIFWHAGLPPAAIAYVLLKDQAGPRFALVHDSARTAILTSIAAVALTVCVLTWLVTAGVGWVPSIMVDAMHATPRWHYIVAPILLLINIIAVALLWMRRRSVLDLWILVVLWAWLIETALLSLTAYRFSLVWYAGRIYGILSTGFVLLLLLTESTMLYARLARSNVTLQRERNNKLMNVDAAVASISHEMRQPLMAIAMNGETALEFLEQTPPNHEELRSVLNDMIDESHRAGHVLDDIRVLFKITDQGHEPINVNEIALEVLRILRGELEEHGITTRVDLTPELPRVMGHGGQVREVLLNLVQNAIEAMNAVKDGSRVLRVRTESHDGDGITVAVEDSGPGIDPEKLEDIFNAFVTTKSQGMGLGLALCRTIIERHGGQLSAWSSQKRSGALFQFTLPIKSAGSTGDIRF
jgi:signal transduction histidine kinase